MRVILPASIFLVLQLACSDSPSSPSTPAPTRITITSADVPAEVHLSGTLQLTARAEYSGGTTQDVTSSALWRSSDPRLAVVGPSGVVQGGSEGAVDITAAVGGVTGSVHVNVLGGPGSCRTATIAASSSQLGALPGFIRLQVSTPFSECRWTATSDASWLTVGSNTSNLFFDPGRSGDGTFLFVTAANNSLTPRSGRITVSFTDGTTLQYTVNQTQAHCIYTVDPPSRQLESTGGSGSLTVTTMPADCAWTARPDSEYYHPAWQFRASGSGVGNGTASYSVTPSIAHGSSSFRVVVNGTDPNDLPAFFDARIAATP